MSHLLVSSSSVMACSPGDSGPPMLVVTAYSAPDQPLLRQMVTTDKCVSGQASCRVPTTNCQQDTPTLKMEYRDQVKSNEVFNTDSWQMGK